MSKNNFIKHAKSVEHLAKAVEIQNSIAKNTMDKHKDILNETFPNLFEDVTRMATNNDLEGLLGKLKMIKKAEDASKRSNNE